MDNHLQKTEKIEGLINSLLYNYNVLTKWHHIILFEKEKKTCLFKHDSKLCAPHVTLIFHYKNSVNSSLIDNR